MDDDKNALKSVTIRLGLNEFHEEFIKSQQQIRAEYKYLNNLLKIALDELNHKFSRYKNE